MTMDLVEASEYCKENETRKVDHYGILAVWDSHSQRLIWEESKTVVEAFEYYLHGWKATEIWEDFSSNDEAVDFLSEGWSVQAFNNCLGKWANVVLMDSGVYWDDPGEAYHDEYVPLRSDRRWRYLLNDEQV